MSIDSIAYGNGVWVGVGEEKIAWSVDDGATWHFKRMENKNWKRVAFGNGRFVVIADSMGAVALHPLQMP